MATPLNPAELKQSAINIKTRFVAISWRDLAISFGPIALLAIIAVWLAIWFIHPAPPKTITIATGPEHSNFWNTADKYRKIMARNGIKLKIVTSEGSLDNLRKLNDPNSGVDVGFVQGGVAGDMPIDQLVSLGSVAYVPVSVFYRGHKVLDRLSELGGKRVAIGLQGSGSRVLALTLLKANGIEPGGKTELLDMGGDEAAQALTDGKIDAAFLMGDSASPPTMGKLLRTPGVRLLDFAQASAYARRFSYLNELQIPKGMFDFGKNIPNRDMRLIAPTAELVAREDLHPALSDLLIDAAKEVNGGANVLQRAGEFPAPLAHEFRISDDATRYYKSGKGFFYRTLPFWLASLVDRTLVVVLPIILLLIPGFKLVPLLYGWRIKSRIYRWYGTLIALERAAVTHTPEEQAHLLKRLDHIEEAVNRMKMPLAFADQFYVLREHIGFVRSRLVNRS
ncbi:NMT1/THI5 like family protein [Collimonas arenae]|uniref:NMT1/THI5 like family protein n=1 Tax=Collimonas arenae TaxID=279058 RepID=A0A127QJT1_9BURK|nr:TAXI family TRAP transporter solute-binding subunit [Collimonas arenae]AMP10293.1 NMT1/THI5 like family protein [Collimonas arenae]